MRCDAVRSRREEVFKRFTGSARKTFEKMLMLIQRDVRIFGKLPPIILILSGSSQGLGGGSLALFALRDTLRVGLMAMFEFQRLMLVKNGNTVVRL
jgi:hypothetical protein